MSITPPAHIPNKKYPMTLDLLRYIDSRAGYQILLLAVLEFVYVQTHQDLFAAMALAILAYLIGLALVTAFHPEEKIRFARAMFYYRLERLAKQAPRRLSPEKTRR